MLLPANSAGDLAHATGCRRLRASRIAHATSSASFHTDARRSARSHPRATLAFDHGYAT